MGAPFSPASPSSSIGARILAVDDEVEMLCVCGETLERLGGVEVVQEPDPRRAMERIGREHFDLLLLDLRMPFVSGLHLAQKAKKQDPTIPIVVITGYPSAESLRRCQELGVAHYVTKPFQPDDLAARVRQALGR